MLLKQFILFLSIIQLMQCLSIRSNSKYAMSRESTGMKMTFLVWWSRRNENAPEDCDLALDYENPSLAAKICGRKTIEYEFV